MTDGVLDLDQPRRPAMRATGRSLALWLTLAVRTLGGLAGALPPFVAVGFVDRAQYGLATANYALALLLVGPISQFVGLGYMREVVAARGRADPGAVLGAWRPVGTAAIYLYALAALGLLGIAAPLGLGLPDAMLTGGLVVLAMGARLQETHLIAAGRPLTAILMFYVVPPALLCLAIVGLRLGTPLGDFAVVSAAQFIGYGVSLLASTAGPEGRPRALLPPRLPRHRTGWRAEAGAVWVFLGNGVVLSAAEQAPTLMLKACGLAGAIPRFEIARKAGAVPSLMVHAFSMQLTPRLVGLAEAADWPRFRTVLREYVGLLVGLTVLYVAALLTGLWWLRDVPAVESRVDPWLFAALLGSGLITAVASPLGSAVIALRAERWFLPGPALSLILQVAVAAGAYAWLGSLAIALGLLAQNALVSVLAVMAAITVLRRREATSRQEAA